MNIVELKNLVVLARKGVAALGDTISANEAQAAWGAIQSAEGFLNTMAEQAKAAQQAQAEAAVEGGEEGTTSDLHVVNLNSDDMVEETEPQVEDDES